VSVCYSSGRYQTVAGINPASHINQRGLPESGS
jgi:hypothetical protein